MAVQSGVVEDEVYEVEDEVYEAMLRATMARNFEELVSERLLKTATRGGVERQDREEDHIHCERLRDFCRADEVEAYFSNPTKVSAWAMALSRSTARLVRVATAARRNWGSNVRLPCSLCLSPYAFCSHLNGSVGTLGPPIHWTRSQATLTGVGPAVHEAILLLTVTGVVLNWDQVPSRDRLIEYVTGEMDLRSDDGSPVVPLVGLLDLMNQVDNELCARAPHLAAAIISLCLTRRRVASYAAFNADDVMETILRYLQNVATRVFNNDCLVEERFGVVELINILPLLLYAAEHRTWRQALVRNFGIIISIATYICQLCHNTHNVDFENDGAPDFERFPCFRRGFVLVDVDHDLATTRPFAFATCALLEVLARWHNKGLAVARIIVPDDEDLGAVLNSYYDHPDWPQYRNWLTDLLTNRDPRFTYGLAILQALVSHQDVDIHIPTSAILRQNLERRHLRCALPGCDRTTSADTESPLRSCNGGCEGLARYCSVDHQRLHWRRHKRHCQAVTDE